MNRNMQVVPRVFERSSISSLLNVTLKPWGQKLRLNSGNPVILKRSEKCLALVTKTKARELLVLHNGSFATEFSPTNTIVNAARILSQMLLNQESH
jgi:hypothetical protein